MLSTQQITVDPRNDSNGKHCITVLEVWCPDNTPHWKLPGNSGHAKAKFEVHLQAGWMQVNTLEAHTRNNSTVVVSARETYMCLEPKAVLALRDMLNEAFPPSNLPHWVNKPESAS